MTLDLIRSRYQPLATVGRGSQGEVLHALDTLHAREVALKVRRVRSPSEREALVQEASVLLNLRPHPGIALVREDFFLRQRYYLVLDWVEGKSLARLLAEEGDPGLPFDRVLDYLDQVAEAVDHLHAHEPPIVHGDVKPANIVVTDAGSAVLVDFGISTRAARRQAGLGTPAYLAPEVAAGAEPSPATDLFSLAATTYALLTGSAPEPGLASDWHEIAPMQRDRLEQAFARGLAFAPEARPQSAGEFLALLRPPPVPHNLPAPLSSFVGRERELAELKRLLRTTRLLTLTGPGGCGKTRLALELAAQLRWRHADGVWLAELASLRDPALVATALAGALGVREEPGQPLSTSVAEAIAGRQTLLVLDNCEHLLEACAELAEVLLRACPQLRIVATSREPLEISGETTWPVEPLAVPELDSLLPPAELLKFDAVRLFQERARAAQPAFALGDENVPAVASVCRRLDGIPLALEMAAALLRSLPLEEIAAGIDQHLTLLAGGRTAPPRQRTLRATLDWSHELLSEPERVLFGRLSVFAGGCMLDAAEAVCGHDLAAPGVRNVLERLAARSLVVRERDGEAPRFALLETVRAYAAEKLASEGDPEQLRRRHRDWFLRLAERAYADRLLPGQRLPWLHRLEADHANLRAALDLPVETPADEEAVLRLAGALFPFWSGIGHQTEGRSRLEALIARSDGADQTVRARALLGAGVLAGQQGDYEQGRAFLQESLPTLRKTSPGVEVVRALNSLAVGDFEQGDFAAAIALWEEGLGISREVGDRNGVATSLHNLAVGARSSGDWSRARSLQEEALAIREELGDRRAIAASLVELGEIARAEGELRSAQSLHLRALALAREARHKTTVEWALMGLGDTARAQGDLDESEAAFAEALAFSTEVGDKRLMARSLTGLGAAAAARGNGERAARLLAAASSLREAIAFTLPPIDREEFEQYVAAARSALAEDAFAEAWTEGAAMSLAAVLDYASELSTASRPGSR